MVSYLDYYEVGGFKPRSRQTMILKLFNVCHQHSENVSASIICLKHTGIVISPYRIVT